MRRGAAVLASIALLAIALQLAAPQTLAVDLSYKPGDWIKYRYSVSGTIPGVTLPNITTTTSSCVFIFKLTIEDVKGSEVAYSTSLESIEKGADNPICTQAASMPTSRRTIDVSSLGPESKELLINPSYSGEYTTKDGFKLRYNNGVLTYAEANQYGISLKLELIDTSIQSLKPYSLLSIIGILAIAAALVAIAIILIRRKTKVETTQTSPAPVQPPTQQPQP